MKNPTWEDIRRWISECTTRNVNECWVWQRPLSHTGYGRIWGKAAHRISYEAYVGPIGEGLDIDHLCRNRACVNPKHLEPVTRQANLARGIGKQESKRRALSRKKCIRGHVLTVEKYLYVTVINNSTV